MTKLLNLADIHLKGRDLEHKVKALQWAREVATENQCAAILIAGDLTDTEQVGDRLITPGGVVEAWRSVWVGCNIPRYIIRGNHDQRTAEHKSSTILFDSSYDLVFDNPQAQLRHFDSDGRVRLVCLPWLYDNEIILSYGSREELWHQLKNLGSQGNTSILLAHCRVAGARKNNASSEVFDAADGFVIPKDVLEAFSYLVLGDIHLRQEILPGRGGFVGALTQEGQDEEGNPSGAELLTIDGQQITSQWLECPCAPRYVTKWVTTVAEVAALAAPDPLEIVRVRYLFDGSPTSLELQRACERLAPMGIRVEPDVSVMSQLRTNEQLEHLDDPQAALAFYAKAQQMPDEEHQELRRELQELLA